MTDFNPAPTDTLPATPSGHRPAVTSFPAADGITDTQTFRALMPVWTAQLMAFFTHDRVLRGAATRIRALIRTLKALHKTETENYAAWMVRAMTTDPEWQAQVRSDLGGEPALAAWEARRAHLQPERPERPQVPDRSRLSFSRRRST